MTYCHPVGYGYPPFLSLKYGDEIDPLGADIEKKKKNHVIFQSILT